MRKPPFLPRKPYSVSLYREDAAALTRPGGMSEQPGRDAAVTPRQLNAILHVCSVGQQFVAKHWRDWDERERDDWRERDTIGIGTSLSMQAKWLDVDEDIVMKRLRRGLRPLNADLPCAFARVSEKQGVVTVEVDARFVVMASPWVKVSMPLPANLDKVMMALGGGEAEALVW